MHVVYVGIFIDIGHRIIKANSQILVIVTPGSEANIAGEGGCAIIRKQRKRSSIILIKVEESIRSSSDAQESPIFCEGNLSP